MPRDCLSNEELVRLLTTSKTPEDLLGSFRGYLKVALKVALSRELNAKHETAFHLCVKVNILLLPVLFSYGKPISINSLQSPYELLLKHSILCEDANTNIVYHFFLAAIGFIQNGADISSRGDNDQNIFELLAQANLDGENKLHLLGELFALVPSSLHLFTRYYCIPARNFIAQFKVDANLERCSGKLNEYFKFKMCIFLNEQMEGLDDSVHSVLFLPAYIAQLLTDTPPFIRNLKFPLPCPCPKSRVDMVLFAIQYGKGHLFGWNHRIEHFYANFCHYYPQAVPLLLKQLEGKTLIPKDLFNHDSIIGGNCRLSEIIPILNLIESRRLALFIIAIINARRATPVASKLLSLPFDLIIYIFNCFNTDKPHGSIAPFMHFVRENYPAIREKIRQKESTMFLQDSSREKPAFRLYQSMRLFSPVYSHHKPKAAPTATGRCQPK